LAFLLIIRLPVSPVHGAEFTLVQVPVTWVQVESAVPVNVQLQHKVVLGDPVIVHVMFLAPYVPEMSHLVQIGAVTQPVMPVES
jgi:hypothetical protein